MFSDPDAGAAKTAVVPPLPGELLLIFELWGLLSGRMKRAALRALQPLQMRRDAVVRRVLPAADKGFFCWRKGGKVAEQRDVNS